MTKGTFAIGVVVLAGLLGAAALVMSTKKPAATVAHGPATLSGWIPLSLEPKPAGAGSWTFQYPTQASDLIVPPVSQPHVLLNLGYPIPIHAIKVAAEPPGAYKVWATLLGEQGKGEEVVLVAEGSGPEMEVLVPPKYAGRPMAALRLSYSAGAATYEEAATIDPARIHPEHGKAFTAPVPASVGPPDDENNPALSTLGILEDDKPLGPAHTLHDTIRKLAGGHYSHWGDVVVFSSSDGTDPRTNGRRYKLMTPKKHEIRLTFS